MREVKSGANDQGKNDGKVRDEILDDEDDQESVDLEEKKIAVGKNQLISAKQSKNNFERLFKFDPW